MDYRNKASWDVVQHPMKDLLEVRRPEGLQRNHYSDVVLKRPQEFDVEVQLDPGCSGVYDQQIRIFDCEYLWKMTRYCVGKSRLRTREERKVE